jgi:catalase
MQVPKGRVNYEPNSLSDASPAEDPARGFTSHAARGDGERRRVRSESFADHYSQARQFLISQTGPELDHIVAALAFELSKVETAAVRMRVLQRLGAVDGTLAERVAAALGTGDEIEPINPGVPARTDLPASPALSILAKAKPTLEGRRVGCLLGEGADARALTALRTAVEAAGGALKLIAPTLGGVTVGGKPVAADFQLAGGPSVLFDAVCLVMAEAGAAALAREAAAVGFVQDAFAHLKVIGHTPGAAPLLARAGVEAGQPGVLALDGEKGARAFGEAAAAGRIWEREAAIRTVF